MSRDFNATTNPFGAEGEAATDALWIIISAFIIFTMQSGFGLLESGTLFLFYVGVYFLSILPYMAV